MSLSNTNLTNWCMSDYEVGYTIVPPWCSSGGSLQLYIPKLMPDISQGRPKSTTVQLNKSCFINDKKCEPPVSSSISTQNYITVPPQDNRTFQDPIFYPGSRVYVEVHNRNPDNLFITTKEDNSSPYPY